MSDDDYQGLENWRIMAMTVLEKQFMETVPHRLSGIEKQLTRIADALERIAEGGTDVGVKCKEE